MLTAFQAGLNNVANRMTSEMTELNHVHAVSAKSRPLGILFLNFDACWQEMLMQASEAIQTAGASIQETHASMSEIPKKLTRIGRRKGPNGYDADIEGVCDRRTGPKSNKVLKIHVRTGAIAFSFNSVF
jgi:hypothetical protein